MSTPARTARQRPQPAPSAPPQGLAPPHNIDAEESVLGAILMSERPMYAIVIEEGLRRVGQVCIAVRDTHGIDEKNPLPFFAVKQRIEAALSAHAGRFVVIALPNITNVFYGRDVGYSVERIMLDEATEEISATKLRRLAANPADSGRPDAPHTSRGSFRS